MSIDTLSLQFGVMVLLKWLGIIVSALLLWYEVDKTNTTLKKFVLPVPKQTAMPY